MGLRVVVIGATGNVGTSVLEALGQEPLIDEIVGVARRRPELEMPKTSWAEADVADRDRLVEILRGANAAISTRATRRRSRPCSIASSSGTPGCASSACGQR